MKILGDKLGMKYDHSILFLKYIKIYMKCGIKLCNWKNCKEFIENPDMYDYFDLKNKTMVEIGVQYGDYTAYFNKRYNTKIIGFDEVILISLKHIYFSVNNKLVVVYFYFENPYIIILFYEQYFYFHTFLYSQFIFKFIYIIRFMFEIIIIFSISF